MMVPLCIKILISDESVIIFIRLFTQNLHGPMMVTLLLKLFCKLCLEILYLRRTLHF